MDAEAPRAVELSLPQAVLLLATDDKDGTPQVPVFALRTAVAGAVLAELDLIGAIELHGKHVKATGAAATTDFQRELEIIRGKSRPHTPKAWVAMLEGRAEVQRVSEGLAARGILEPVGDKPKGLFRTRKYAEKDHAPETMLLTKIEAALAGAPYATPGPGKPQVTAPDDRTVALIALLQAAGMLAKLFPAADKTWADELAKDYWPARAVEDELRLIRIAEEEAATL